jgi:hypothetical protein
LLWDDDHVEVSNIHIGTHLILENVTIRYRETSFKLTTVYGPTDNAEKEEFLDEAITAKPADDSKWLIIGYFNIIYQGEDKNNGNLNFRMMGLFRRTLVTCQLKELKLQNRKFTWSNGRETPTLVRLDRAFFNAIWDLEFENHILHALSSSLSDHCPLLLSNQSGPQKPPIFRFESFWTKLPGFKESVQLASFAPSSHSQPVHITNHKLKTTALGLKS